VEITLDVLAFMTERDDEFIEAVMRVDPHDMREDWKAANLDHGFGPNLGLLGKPCAPPTGQNRNSQNRPVL
jgi:hypothetical protein